MKIDAKKLKMALGVTQRNMKLDMNWNMNLDIDYEKLQNFNIIESNDEEDLAEFWKSL